ncbi:unnamed protein product [Penicillium salamii]|uniref:PNPLA domain-containing protein n=1 Tax=Penicillium salamii TaxID=1612424 RepID=A0A9W4NXV0_9EURO|nr:unnamed protein product [Penicillium salamii]
MQHKEDIGWLDIGKQQNSRLAIVENRRLKYIISQLENPEEQYPSLCAFIGGPLKNCALQKLYPWNNIRRHVSDYKIRLRYNVSSLGTRQPVLFVDGDIIQKDHKSPLKQLSAGAGYPIFWECGSAQFLLLVLWARLVFLFNDVICIFIDDYPESSQILKLLTTFSQGRSTDPLILIHRKLLEPGLTSVYESFSEITTLRLGAYEASNTARYKPLRSLVRQELSSMRALRKKHLIQPNGKQLVDLFQATFQHILMDFESRFNLLQATRAVYKICSTAGLDAAQIIPTIASAVLMDHYVPRILIELRKSQLASQSGWICRIRSNKICLYCLFQNAQHVLGCGHTLCDHYAHVFGTPSVGIEYEFTIRGYIYCLYQRPLIASVLPLTMSPSVLTIDGGGVKGVIPLEFLLLVHEHLHPYRIQDIVDLALGTSSILGNLSKWIHWLLHDSYYDAKTFDDALKGVFDNNRLMFGSSRDNPRESLRSNSKVRVVTTSISRETGAFVIGNFNTTGEPGDRAVSEQGRLLRHLCKTRGPPSFFTPTDLPGIGSFQDRGLKHNFAREIASQVSRQIWPEAIGSTHLLSLGTRVTKPEVDPTPHFRHIFRDSFIRRGFDAWISDYHRLNVELNRTPNTIDSVETINDYRNLVLGQPGNSRRAQQATTTLLCRGSIRCKGSARDVIMALIRLYPEGLTYVSGKNMVDSFHGLDDLYESCGSYLRPLSFIVYYFNHPVNLFLQASLTHRWRLNRFPESLANFAAKQGLTSLFGHSNHGFLGRIACGGYKILSGSSKTKRHVYLLICSSRETYVYNSNEDDPSWLPPDSDLVLFHRLSVFVSIGGLSLF